MNFTCDKNVLSDAVNKVDKIVPTKSGVHAAEGILLELFDDGRLKLTGYDFTVGIETYIDTERYNPGSIIVNAKLFADILNNIPSGYVTIETGEGMSVKIICESLDFTLIGMDAALFPSVPPVEKKDMLVIKQSALCDLIRKTSSTVMQNDMNPVLKGMLLKSDEEGLMLVSSDTYRLSVCRFDGEYTNQKGNNIKSIIPGRAFTELMKLLDSSKSDDEVSICLSDTHCAFETDSFRMITSLIKGEFVNYKKVTPTVFKNVIKVRTEDLNAAVTRASLLLSNEKLATPVRFTFEFDRAVVSLFKDNGHRYTDEVPVELAGENFEIGFNNRHLLGILSCIEDEYIYLKANSPLSPVCITPLEGDAYYYLISPMRLGKN